MSRTRQIWIWIGVLAATILVLWSVNEILPPFLIGIAIAYFLDPIADRIERLGVSRFIATALITIAFFACAVTLAIVLVPLIQQQALAFVQKVPALIDTVRAWLEPITERLRYSVSQDRIAEIQEAGKSIFGNLAQWFGRLLAGLLAGGLAVFNAISIVIITPVVAFYLLRDWDEMVAKLDSWLPRQFAPTVRTLVREIDTIISGFVRGTGTVVLFLASVYSIGLTAIGLEFGLVVGLGAGLLSFIPYVGSLAGVCVAVLIALAQFGDLLHIVLVLAVFGVGQTIESFFLTPKLVGEKVGLHPVWVIFALMAGGLLLGFTGVLLAIPIAATIGVLVRFFLKQYLASPLYGGETGSASDDASDGR